MDLSLLQYALGAGAGRCVRDGLHGTDLSCVLLDLLLLGGLVALLLLVGLLLFAVAQVAFILSKRKMTDAIDASTGDTRSLISGSIRS